MGLDGVTSNDANRYGVVYVYQRNLGDLNDVTDDTWTLTQTLTALDKGNDDAFGQDVAISADGTTIVIGAYLEDTGGTDRGSVYVFEGTPGSYSQKAKLTNNGGAASDNLGFSVSVNEDGSIVAAGARLKNNALANDEGSVFMFHRDAVSGWAAARQFELQAGDPDVDDEFGRGVAISGNRVVVGAQLEDTNGSNAGAAYVFEFDGYVWQQIQKITPSDA